MNISKISEKYFNDWVAMGVALWPQNTKRELTKEFRALLRSKKYATFIARSDQGETVAFINLSLRSDYVEGSSSNPVAYVEGIYVKPKYRQAGMAKELIKRAERWTRKKCCTELASDTELQNRASQKFHKSIGFKKAGTIVHFIKKISRPQ